MVSIFPLPLPRPSNDNMIINVWLGSNVSDLTDGGRIQQSCGESGVTSERQRSGVGSISAIFGNVFDRTPKEGADRESIDEGSWRK